MTLKSVALPALLASIVLLSACAGSKTVESLPRLDDEPATAEEDITGEWLLERHVEALGGLDDIKALETLKWEGNIETMGMVMPITYYQARPNRTRSEVQVPGQSITVINGFDGETAWTITPMAGPDPVRLPEEHAEITAAAADFDGALIEYEDKGYAVEYLGTGVVRGEEAYRLRVDGPGENDHVVFLDADTYLESKVETRGVNPRTGQITDTAIYPSDFREVAGVMKPYSIEVAVGGDVMQAISIETYEENVDLDDELFVMPTQ